MQLHELYNQGDEFDLDLQKKLLIIKISIYVLLLV